MPLPLPTGIAISKDGCLLRGSGSLADIFGYAWDELRGKPIVELIAEESRELVGRLVRENADAAYECVALRKDGTRRLLQVTAMPCPACTFQGRVAAVRDITEQRENEQQLRQAQKMEAVGQIAGGVAHDFNNMLTAIGGYAELLRDELLEGDPRRGEVEEILRAVRRAATLIRQLMAFSRRQELQPVPLDLAELIAGVEPMLRRVISEDIEFVTELDPNLAPILADPGSLEQVLMNLVVNARDAISGIGRITVVTRETELAAAVVLGNGHSAGRYVELAVSDTGVGMPTEIRQRIFEPYFTTKPAGHGTGLGLSTVYGIVKQSGGHIAVESTVGKGSTFRLRFPVWSARAVAARTSPPAGVTIPL